MTENSIKAEAETIKYKLIKFCKSHKNIYLYGAGNYGKLYYNALKTYGVDFKAFITTNKNKNVYLGKLVYTVAEIIPKLKKWDGIIFAAKSVFYQNMKKTIELYNVSLDYFWLDDKDIYLLEVNLNKHLLQILPLLEKKFPVKKELNLNKWKKILVIRLDRIGDLIWTTAFLRELRANFSRCKIDVVIRSQNKDILISCPYINRLYLYNCGANDTFSIKTIKKAKSFSKKYLLKNDYDAVFLPKYTPITLRDSWDDFFLAVYSGTPTRIGRLLCTDGRGEVSYKLFHNFFTVLSKDIVVEHEVSRILNLLKIIGCKINNDRMELWSNEKTDYALNDLLNLNEVKTNNIFIAVGLVATDRERTWNAVNYQKVIQKIVKVYDNKIKFVLLGGKDALFASTQIDNANTSVINLVAKTTLEEVIAIIKRMDLYLGSNTGLLHIASAFRKPVIEISGSRKNEEGTSFTAPSRVGAWRTKNVVIYSPNDEDEYAIDEIKVDSVIEPLKKMINQILNSTDKLRN